MLWSLVTASQHSSDQESVRKALLDVGEVIQPLDQFRPVNDLQVTVDGLLPTFFRHSRCIVFSFLLFSSPFFCYALGFFFFFFSISFDVHFQ